MALLSELKCETADHVHRLTSLRDFSLFVGTSISQDSRRPKWFAGDEVRPIVSEPSHSFARDEVRPIVPEPSSSFILTSSFSS